MIFNKKNIIRKIITIIFILFILCMFYKINEKNYTKHLEIKSSLVEHPENLPKKDYAKLSSFWFKNLRADIYWLQAIQYIWWNAISSEYKKYRFVILDLITELNPYFEHPYIIGQLLLPSYQPRYETLTEDEQMNHIDEAITLWLKWVENFCYEEKIKEIEKEPDLLKLWNDPKYKDPCLSYEVPYYLAYIYFYYKNNPIEAAKYYKISSAISESPEWAKIMSAIMQWKWGNREKSFFMFLNIAKFVEPENEVCNTFSTQLENVWFWTFISKELILSWNILKEIETLRQKLFSSDNADSLLEDTKCSNYINKAVRELNLSYIEQANTKYKKDLWKNSQTAKQLFEKWYIDYLPVDFQQYDDHWIVYIFNKDTWNYDYEIWNY